MRRYLAVAAAAALVGAFAFPAPGLARGTRIEICHRSALGPSDGPAWRLLPGGGRAAEFHLDHGDVWSRQNAREKSRLGKGEIGRRRHELGRLAVDRRLPFVDVVAEFGRQIGGGNGERYIRTCFDFVCQPFDGRPQSEFR